MQVENLHTFHRLIAAWWNPCPKSVVAKHVVFLTEHGQRLQFGRPTKRLSVILRQLQDWVLRGLRVDDVV